MSTNKSPHKAKLKVGDPAPDATVYDEDGHEVRLSSLWGDGTTVLVFIRHFG